MLILSRIGINEAADGKQRKKKVEKDFVHDALPYIIHIGAKSARKSEI